MQAPARLGRSAGTMLVALSLLATTCSGSADLQEMQLKYQVEQALRSIRSVLNSTRRPQYPADVPHVYDDKYLLAEFATKAAASGLLNLLDALASEPGWWIAHQATLLEWAGSARVVTLRFSACERCAFDRTETIDLDSGSKTVTESIGGWVSSTVKTVTTVQEHSWRFNGTWELYAFPGTQESDRILLRRGTGLQTIKTRTSKDAELVPPRPEVLCKQPLDFDMSWLLAQAGSGGLDFSVNRSDEKCRTPRRNPDVDAAVNFFAQLSLWSFRASHYLIKELFPVQQASGLDVDAVEAGDVLHPVHALFALDSGLEGGSLQRPAMAESFWAVMSEHRGSLARDLARLQEVFPAEGGLITVASAAVAALLTYARSLSQDYESVVDAIEGMLYGQLAAAVGKELSSADFTEYMDFHYRKLFKPELKPSRFSYAVRRPGQSPEGVVSIEVPLPGAGGARSTTVPIQTVAARREATRPMRLALSAATDVEFLGERYLHPIVLHRFSRQPHQELSLVARARQFSSFVLLVGRVLSAERFEPAAALVIKDRDDLHLPLLLETVPAPKEFRDAIVSMSPEQQRFARAFREMQLSSTLFGLLIVQIKPQMEEVLNLPANSLTKEIRLTQDLMELFIKYQVPSDLLSYDEGLESENRSRLQVVQDHVSAMMATINASRRRELEEEEERAASRKLRTGEPQCGAHCHDVQEEEEEHETVEYSVKRTAKARPTMRMAAMELSAASGSPQVLQLAAMPRSAGVRRMTSLPPSSMPPAPSPMPPPPSPTPPPPAGKLQESPAWQQQQQQQQQQQPGPEGGAEPDYAALPGLLDRSFERLDVEGTLRPTKVVPGPIWKKRESPGLLAPMRERSLHGDAQAEERDRAFDLLDALTRSGALPVRRASLHVILAATHGFDQTLIDTIVQGNVNPIEKVERSVLIMTSTLQQQAPESLVAPAQLARIRAASPGLFAARAEPEEPLSS